MTPTFGTHPIVPRFEPMLYAAWEPYGEDDQAMTTDLAPASLWTAIQVLCEERPDIWQEMSEKLWKLKESHLLMTEAVMHKVRMTNKCEHFGGHVEFWVDPRGKFKISVYS